MGGGLMIPQTHEVYQSIPSKHCRIFLEKSSKINIVHLITFLVMSAPHFVD